MQIEYAAFQAWLDRYIAAWKSYDPDAIGNLFSETAAYRFHPQDDPVIGRASIVVSWLEDRDEAGSYDARYEPLAIDGENHVASGVSRYFDTTGTLRDEYCNVFLCRFDEAGRCREFTEWWIRNRRFARAAAQQPGVEG